MDPAQTYQDIKDEVLDEQTLPLLPEDQKARELRLATSVLDFALDMLQAGYEAGDISSEVGLFVQAQIDAFLCRN